MAHNFPFPYLHDETQAVARAYGAVCTPDFFGYDKDRKLKYRGRLDEGRTAGTHRGHACDRSDRRGARGSSSFRGLLDQMEGGIARALAMPVKILSELFGARQHLSTLEFKREAGRGIIRAREMR